MKNYILLIAILFFSSCSQKFVYKVEPKKQEKIKKTVLKKHIEPKLIRAKKTSLKFKKLSKIEQKIFNKQISIKASNKKKMKKYNLLIKTAFSFLYKNFGKPKYTKKIEVVIHKKSIKHPTSTWSTHKNKIRKINFTDFYMFESELPTIVHELFHALYQTNDFILSNSEFIIEGSATYVEKLYKYKGNTKKIKSMFYQDMKMNHICKKFNKKYNFNKPFQIQSKRKIYYLYILSGGFFSIQDNTTGKELIKKLLNVKSNKNSANNSIDKHIKSIFTKMLNLKKYDKNTIENIIKIYKLNPIKKQMNISYFCKKR